MSANVSTSVSSSGSPSPRFQIRLTRARIREITITLILIPICIAWIYPFIWTVSASLKTNRDVFGQGLELIPNEVMWENYSRAWDLARIETYFFNTVVIAIGSVLIVLVTTSMIGYVLGRYSFPGRRWIIGLYVVTVFLPKGYTIIPIFELINTLGLDGSLFGIILAQSGTAHVIFILLFSGYFRQLPREIEEAAIIDGASFVGIYVRIMLPLAKPIIATVVIMQLISSWNDFLLPLVLTLTKPDLRTLSVGMYAFRGEHFTDWSGMAAASVISIAPILIVFLFMQRYFIEGVAGAVKQ